MSKGSTRIINSKTSGANFSNSSSYDDEHQLRRGPWTLEEDNLLIHYITCHGEGRWNSLAKCAGLKRTGKSCRLRWLNYLKPDVKRGNLTPPEQLLILELHSKWGNRWSRIAQHLPGRTDNEIKNYWRTRVQKQARQLKVDSNSERFLEAIRTFWMPRLLEKIEQNNSSPSLKPITTLDTPNQVFLPSMSTNTFDNNSTVELSASSSLNPQLSYGKKIPPPVEEDGSCYHVDNNIPSCYDDVVQDFESHDTCCVSGGLHVAELDWFGEDLGTSTFWNNTDELWQFRKPEELGHVQIEN